jgi:hypothetical protein
VERVQTVDTPLDTLLPPKNSELNINITQHHINFVDDFSYLLDKKQKNQTSKTNTDNHDPNYFRWFDTGDIQDLEMLWCVNEIAYSTPNIKHWLPTKEARILLNALNYFDWAWSDNLTVRLSIHMRDKTPSSFWRKQQLEAFNKNLTLSFSQVFTPSLGPAKDWFECPALQQGHKCLSCRHCWTMEDVAYPWRES